VIESEVRATSVAVARPARAWGQVATAAAICAFGVVLLVLVYRWAASAPPRYDLFWIAMACMLVPLWLIALSGRVAQEVVLTSIVLLGLGAYFPAFLRAPDRPVFGDAMGHYLSVENTLRSGNLFSTNPVVHVASYYPGLHGLTAALVQLSGASIWHVGIALVALFHVATLLGIYAVCSSLNGSPRAAALAAVIYSVSPQFGFFDSQFAYESLAVPLLVWALALTLYATRGDGRQPRAAVSAVAGFVGLCCVVTHHLTSYILAALLLVTGLLELVVHQRRKARNSLRIGLLVGACGAAWVFITGAPIGTYLGYFPRTAYEGIGPIMHRILGETPAAAGAVTATSSRGLFSGSTLPTYEHYAAYATQVFALVVTLVAAWRLRRRRSGALYTFGLLAVSYFVILPLRLNLAGEEGANRVATFQWIAIVVSLGLVGEPWDIRPGQQAGNLLRRATAALVSRAWLSAGVAAVLAFIGLVGNYGAATNASLQFPGAYVVDSTDGRDASVESAQLAQRFLQAEGPDQVVAADFSTARTFETYAYTSVSDAFPVWQFFDPDYSSSQLQDLASTGRVTAIVIDDRLVDGGGQSGTYPGYPPASRPPVTPAVLHRLSSFPWVSVMYRTPNYTVLRVLGRSDAK
jgi:hypothetical protein